MKDIQLAPGSQAILDELSDYSGSIDLLIQALQQIKEAEGNITIRLDAGYNNVTINCVELNKQEKEAVFDNNVSLLACLLRNKPADNKQQTENVFKQASSAGYGTDYLKK